MINQNRHMFSGAAGKEGIVSPSFILLNYVYIYKDSSV